MAELIPQDQAGTPPPAPPYQPAAAPVDLTSGARGVGAAQATLGQNPFGQVFANDAERLMALPTDIAVKTPVGLAALGADTVLGTGLTKAVDSQGHPAFESGKLAYDTLMSAFGRVQATTSSPYLSTLAGGAVLAGAIGENLATPGSGGVSGALKLTKSSLSVIKYFKVLADSAAVASVNNTLPKPYQHLVGEMADLLIKAREGGVYQQGVYEALGSHFGTLPAGVKTDVLDAMGDLQSPKWFPPTPAPAQPVSTPEQVWFKKVDGSVRDAFTDIGRGSPLRADQVNVLRRSADGQFGDNMKQFVLDQLATRNKMNLLNGPVSDHISNVVRARMATGDFFAGPKSPDEYVPFKQVVGKPDFTDADSPHWQHDGGVAYGMKNYESVVPTLTRDEVTGIQLWHSTGYDRLASALRPNPKPGQGSWLIGFFKMIEDAQKAGRVLATPGDQSFISVSSSHARAESFARFGMYGSTGAILEYHVPAGTNMAFVDAVIHNLPEEEWLLPRYMGWKVKEVVRPLANPQDLPGHVILQVVPTAPRGFAKYQASRFKNLEPPFDQAIQNIESAIQKYKSKENLVFYRGVAVE